MEHAELGRLVLEYPSVRRRAAECRAWLARTGEDLELLGDFLKRRPGDVLVGEGKLTLRDAGGSERTLPLASLDVVSVLRTLGELERAVEEEGRLAGRLREGGFGYLVDTLESAGLPFSGGAGGSPGDGAGVDPPAGCHGTPG